MDLVSLLPLLISGVVALALISVFYWNAKLLAVCLVLCCVIAVAFFVEVQKARLDTGSFYLSAFWLFLLSEVMLFCAFMNSLYWYNKPGVPSIGAWRELPWMGTVLLIGSSVGAACYYHSFERWYLKYTIYFGAFFLVLQCFEAYDCKAFMFDNPYVASAFCVIGLHALHLVVGLSALIYLYWYLNKDETVSYFFITLVIWYWHFVDFIWVFVYISVYVL